jgi:hypothetical protein
MGKKRNTYRVLVGKPKGQVPLGRPRHRWDDNVQMGLREIGLGVWIGFIWLRIGVSGGILLIMNLGVP